MLKALRLVATRKNPQINIGAVDMSCAFVVCDVAMNDCPIVYVSDNFQNLTGYSRHDIIGQNCRFLQAPDGSFPFNTWAVSGDLNMQGAFPPHAIDTEMIVG